MTLAKVLFPSYVVHLMPVASALKPHISGTAPVEAGRAYCGHDALAVVVVPAPVAHQRSSFAPADPPKVMVFHVGAASVPELNWLLIVVKSAIVVLLPSTPLMCEKRRLFLPLAWLRNNALRNQFRKDDLK